MPKKMRHRSHIDGDKRTTSEGPRPFVPLRELLSWADADDKKKNLEKEARDDVSDLIRTTNLDLNHTRGELAFFLAAVLFVIVTTLSITDRDLLFGSHVQLPILGLSMSFDAFLLGSPLLLLSVHYTLLLKFGRIRDKCQAIDHAIHDARIGDADVARGLALKAASNFMAQWLIGETGNAFNRRLSAMIYFLSIWLAPVFTFLLLTIRTLPLHRSWLTGVQILALSLDVALLALFHGGPTHQKRRCAITGVLAWLGASLVLCVPDGTFDLLGRALWPATVPFGSRDQRTAFAPTAFLLENGLDNATGRPILFFSRNLIVTDDRNGVGRGNRGQSLDKQKEDSEPNGPNFRGRDLRYAVLDRSDLRKADFSLADLTGASLVNSDLRGATFGCAAQNADVVGILWARLLSEKSDGSSYVIPANCTIMTGIKLNDADLRDTHFVWAQDQKPSLAGSSLVGAKLDGVDLSATDLSTANLMTASLVGADLSNATLIGTNLSNADLTGAILDHADMRLAALTYGRLDGAYLVGARLVAADFSAARLIGAELGQAALYGAGFNKAAIWGSTPPEKEYLAWTNLAGAQIEQPSKAVVDAIEESLKRMPDSERNSARIRDFENFIHTPSGDKDTAAKNEVWKELLKLLARDPNDSSFRKMESELITDNACQDAEVTAAVEYWARPGGYSYDTYSPGPPLPSPLPDPALQTMVSHKFFTPGIDYSTSFYPDTVVPLPAWYDLAQLIHRLESGACPAMKAVDPGLLVSMKSSEEVRHAAATSVRGK